MMCLLFYSVNIKNNPIMLKKDNLTKLHIKFKWYDFSLFSHVYDISPTSVRMNNQMYFLVPLINPVILPENLIFPLKRLNMLFPSKSMFVKL